MMNIRETTIYELQDNRIVCKTYRYCGICGSINIKKSSKGNDYCGDICWKEEEYKQKNDDSYRDRLSDRCGGEMCIEY